jgi:hypothetical protein
MCPRSKVRPDVAPIPFMDLEEIPQFPQEGQTIGTLRIFQTFSREESICLLPDPMIPPVT